ncbi:MAG: acetyl-CoA carboxylase biotin carboxyl carrier protein subunit, partial [Pseudomonadales bacterium]
DAQLSMIHHLEVVDGNARRGAYWMGATERLFINLESRCFTVIDAAALDSDAEEAGGGGVVVAPMHGLLLAILVTEGDRVCKGDRLAVLEAMKMQHEILAEVDGSVIRVAAAADTQVAANDLILEIEPTEDT